MIETWGRDDVVPPSQLDHRWLWWAPGNAERERRQIRWSQNSRYHGALIAVATLANKVKYLDRSSTETDSASIGQIIPRLRLRIAWYEQAKGSFTWRNPFPPSGLIRSCRQAPNSSSYTCHIQLPPSCQLLPLPRVPTPTPDRGPLPPLPTAAHPPLPRPPSAASSTSTRSGLSVILSCSQQVRGSSSVPGDGCLVESRMARGINVSDCSGAGLRRWRLRRRSAGPQISPAEKLQGGGGHEQCQ